MSPAPSDDARLGPHQADEGPARGGAGGKFVMPATAIEIPRQSLAHGGSGNALMVGTWLGEFELLGVVGEGGFGIVYRAWDHSLNRQVAIKEYMPAVIAMRGQGAQVSVRSERQAEAFIAGLRSFVNEAQMLAQFDHPALVKVYRFWEANGSAYMVMPFYEGTTLRDHLQTLDGPPDEATILGWLGPVADALAVIHAQQWYHRDLAPDNIMLLPPAGRPLLLDFGAARRVIGDMTQALTVIMKPGYAPIEQFGDIPGMHQGAWTDLYGLAAVAHFAIRGVTPPASVVRLLNDSYQPLAGLVAGQYSDDFLRAIDHALAVRPQDRPQNVAAFKAALGLSAQPGERANIDYPASHPARHTVAPVAVRPAGAAAAANAANAAKAAHAAPAAAAMAAQFPAAGGGHVADAVNAANPANPVNPPPAAALAAALADTTLTDSAATPAIAIAPAPGRRWMANVLGGLGVLGAVGLTAWLLRPAPPVPQALAPLASAPIAAAAVPAGPGVNTAAVAAPTPTSALATAPATAPTAVLATAPALGDKLDVQAEFKRVVQAQTPGWGLDVVLDKARLRTGHDKLTFNLTSLQGGLVTVYQFAPADQLLMQLYPNNNTPPPRTAKGITLKLPQGRLDFNVDGQPGTNQLLVIVSRWPRDTSALAPRNDNGFLVFPMDAAAVLAARAAADGMARTPGAAGPAGNAAVPALAGRAICPKDTACNDEFGAALVSFEVVR